MGVLLLNIFILSALILLTIEFIINMTRIAMRLTVTKNYGTVLYKVKEHGKINNILAGVAMMLLLILIIIGYFHFPIDIKAWYERDVLWLPGYYIGLCTLFLGLLSQTIVFFLKAFISIEVRDSGINSSLQMYPWKTIDHYKWEDVDAPSWDKENHYCILTLYLKSKRHNEIEMRIREQNKEELNEILKTRLEEV